MIVCPIGFLSDNIEVLWDLDHEVRLQAQAAGLAYARASTPNADRRLARLARGLIEELRDGGAPQRLAGPAGLGCGFGVDGAPCGAAHCAVAVAPRFASGSPPQSYRQADCRIAVTRGAARRAHHRGQRPHGVDRALHRARGVRGGGEQIGADRDDRLDMGGTLQHPHRARRRVIWNAVQRSGFQHLFDLEAGSSTP